MLTRASRNAYSWWWASHIRTKQSKWLDQNIQDMEEKVEYILKIITEDGDSFRTRAEQYYRKRPEIVNFVEDNFREYRALAERYDHLSKDLQSANRTIAIIFPERVQMSMDEEDDEDFSFSMDEHEHKNPKAPSPLPLPLPLLEAPKLNHLPKMENAGQAMLKKKMPTKMMSKKGLIKIGIDEKPSGVQKSSGLSRDEALEEIDKLQKEILGFQTEKEFVKSSYENAISKYWEIENHITEMHMKISNLQDEFEIGTMIEDTDAQNLMASSALKMCEETLDRLKHKQKKVKKEAKVEHKRVDDIRKKFEALIATNDDNSDLKNLEKTGEHVKDKTAKIEEKQQHNYEDQPLHTPKMENLDGNGQEGFVESQPTLNLEKIEGETAEDRKARIKEEILGKNETIYISKVAEKIEQLVDKVINLEIELTSHIALVVRLRLENDDLHEQILSLEQEKNILIEDSNEMKMKIKRLEEQLERIHSLDQKVQGQNLQLATSFDEASVNLDYTSSQLLIAKPEEYPQEDDASSREENEKEEKNPALEEEKKEDDKSYKLEEKNESSQKAKEENLKKDSDDEEENDSLKKDNEETLKIDSDEEEDNQDDIEWQDTEMDMREEPPLTERVVHEEHDVDGVHIGEDDQPKLNRIFSYNKIEEREKMLLEEYTSTLKNYKEVKKKLNETEKKNRASAFKSAIQMKILRNQNDSKDAEIKSLYEKLKLFETNINFDLKKPPDSVEEETETRKELDETVELEQKKAQNLVIKELDEGTHERKELDETLKKDPDDVTTETRKEDEEPTNVNPKKDPDSNDTNDDRNLVSEVEEEIRREIDELRKESLELWLRFSTTYHQINRFQDSTHDLLEEIKEVKEGKEKKPEHGYGHSLVHVHSRQRSSHNFTSDIRPIYRHLQDMLAEVTLWLESSEILEDDLQHRLQSLCEIQNELSDLTSDDSKAEKKVKPLNDYEAAKFQGEVLNMKQENNKVLEELRVACDRVRKLQVDIEETLIKLDEEVGVDGKKKRSGSRSKVPFRSFLFGVKLRKRRRPALSSILSTSLSLQRQPSAKEVPKPKEDSQ